MEFKKKHEHKLNLRRHEEKREENFKISILKCIGKIITIYRIISTCFLVDITIHTSPFNPKVLKAYG